MNTIEVGDVFVDRGHRAGNRTLKVLSVFLPATYGLSEGFVACSYFGVTSRRVTILSYKRLADSVRFEKQRQEEVSYGR